jgi:poly(hydroxyalkanoate) depolymerase family esterase
MRVASAPVLFALFAATLGCSASSGTYDGQPDTGTDGGTDATQDVGADTEDHDVSEADPPDVYPETDTDVIDLDAVTGGGELIKRSYVGPEGTRDYLLYVPKGYDGTPRPLVLALHGCSQSASHFAYVTGYNQLADQEGVLVVWPEQTIVANSTLCWNWFLPGHQRRDVGEAAMLAAIVREVAGTHAVDPKRVHAVGISAGAAMSLVMAAVFPDVFASIGSVEGCPFQGTPCVGSASMLPAATLAGYVEEAMGAYARPVPLFAVQGTLDFNVPPANGDLLVKQWVLAADAVDDGLSNQSIPPSPDHTDSGVAANGHAFVKEVYLDADEEVFIEYFKVDGLGHAWPGGAQAIAYSDPQGPSATDESWRFFEAHPMP